MFKDAQSGMLGLATVPQSGVAWHLAQAPLTPCQEGRPVSPTLGLNAEDEGTDSDLYPHYTIKASA